MEHAHYLDKVSSAVATKITKLVDDTFESSEHVTSDEVRQFHSDAFIHLLHCKKLCKSSVSLNQHNCNIFPEISKLLMKGAKSEHYVIMIEGPINSGKTYLVANVCKKARQMFGPDTVLITRFVGLCPSSTVSENILRDVCTHLNFVLQQFIKIVDYDMSKLKNYFHGLLNRITKGTRHVVLAIDGINELKSFQDECQVYPLEWIVTKLPPKVHIIVTYSSPVPEYIQKLEAKLPMEEYKIKFNQYSRGINLVSFLDELKQSNRTVTKQQETVLLDICECSKCNSVIPILLDTVSKWTSCYEPKPASCPDTFEKATISKLDHLEASFGRCVVKAVCNYITLSKDGLTEMEILDLLSCNNEVLLNVYETLPTIMRFPYTIWASLRLALGNFIFK